jgi:hypothetical protein
VGGFGGVGGGGWVGAMSKRDGGVRHTEQSANPEESWREA